MRKQVRAFLRVKLNAFNVFLILAVLLSLSSANMDYFMWIDWDVPRRMEAKLAVGPLDIDSIVLLLSSSLFIHHCFGVFV
jgi:hypothetical protein